MTFLEEATPGEMLFYNPDDVWESAMDLVEWLDVDLTADKELRFFAINADGDVSAAAFTNCNESTFGFEIVIDPEHSYLQAELVQDCLEEYDILRGNNSDLVLEIADIGTVEVLKEHGFKVLSGSSHLLSE